jgi:hypothetical protein
MAPPVPRNGSGQAGGFGKKADIGLSLAAAESSGAARAMAGGTLLLGWKGQDPKRGQGNVMPQQQSRNDGVLACLGKSRIN